jgi:hypothetical protein
MAAPSPRETQPSKLSAAVRQARLEAAERTGVVIDLQDAELARLEILNELLEPVFADLPAEITLFDRGITPGSPPRLWIDMVAHVVMARDKRVYRFVEDTRYGRRILAESQEPHAIADAITDYMARRMVERERALAGDTSPLTREAAIFAARRRRRSRKTFGWFLVGMLAGAALLTIAAWILEPLI